MATKKNTRQSTAKRKSSSRKTRRKKEYSKVIVAWCFALITFFIMFACYEIHRLEDTSAIEFITDIVKYVTVVAVGGYFFKARAENTAKIQLEYQKQASELRKEYGDDYVSETLEFDNLTGR